jgi:arylsulfatase A-like enzyme
MGPEDFRILLGAYDNSIRYADHLIQRIVGQLKSQGVYDRTMLVILADHGDNIGDHGLMFHYFCLYDTLIRIPLLIKFPQGHGPSGRVQQVVQNVDLFPTVLSLAGSQDSGAWDQAQGNDLLGIEPPRREGDLAVSELVKVFGPDKKHLKKELSRYDRRLLSVRTRDRKFIYSSRGDHECYDLSHDPGEQQNLHLKSSDFSDLEEKARRYYDRMDHFYRENQGKIDGEIDESGIDDSVAEHLKALGYM